MKMPSSVRVAAWVALLAATAHVGAVRADDNPFAFSLAGGGRGAPLPATDGKTIYEHICQGCHMADGTGGKMSPSTYPALAGNMKFVAKLYPVQMVVSGLGAMPAFGALLSDEQVAAVVNFVRGSFGNRYADAVAAAEVAKLRPAGQAAPTELRGR